MKLGLSSYAYRWSIGIEDYIPSIPMGVQQFIEKAVQLKVQGVQICDNLNYQDLSAYELREIKRKIDAEEMFIETGARGSDPSYLKQMLKVSHQLGSNLLRVVTEVSRKGPKDDIRDQIERIILELKEVLGVAQDLDIRLALENHANLSSGELLSIIDSLGDEHVRVCLDTMNSMVLIEHPLDTARMLAPHAITVHLKDFRIDKLPEYHRIEGVALGDGFVDFPKIMGIIKESHQDPSIHLELYIDRKESERETLLWEEGCVVKSLQYAKENLL